MHLPPLQREKQWARKCRLWHFSKRMFSSANPFPVPTVSQNNGFWLSPFLKTLVSDRKALQKRVSINYSVRTRQGTCAVVKTRRPHRELQNCPSGMVRSRLYAFLLQNRRTVCVWSARQKAKQFRESNEHFKSSRTSWVLCYKNKTILSQSNNIIDVLFMFIQYTLA